MRDKGVILEVGVEPNIFWLSEGDIAYSPSYVSLHGWAFDCSDGPEVGVYIPMDGEPLIAGYTIRELHAVWAGSEGAPQ